MNAEKLTPDEILKRPYARVLVPEDPSVGGYSASVQEFPGCFAQGETRDEAYTNLERAAHAWLEAALDQGYEIPSPAADAAPRAYSGRCLLRMSPDLHRRAVECADLDGLSLNQYIVTALSACVGARSVLHAAELACKQAPARLWSGLEKRVALFAADSGDWSTSLHVVPVGLEPSGVHDQDVYYWHSGARAGAFQKPFKENAFKQLATHTVHASLPVAAAYKFSAVDRTAPRASREGAS